MSSSLKLKSNAGGSVSLTVDDTLATDETVRADSIGELQTWQDMTASRAFATTYTNDTGKPIMLAVHLNSSGINDGQRWGGNIVIDGVTVVRNARFKGGSGTDYIALSNIIIPNGSTYEITVIDLGSMQNWFELRG